ncbi:IclR family transcriptional regulator [Chloroflexota bacterium]
MPSSRGTGPQTIHKAVQLLRAFSPSSPEIGVRDLADLVGIPRSTVHRLLTAMEDEGLVKQNVETGRYRLGFELVALAGIALRSMDIRRVALPFMSHLAGRWHETVDLDVLRGGHVIIIEQIAGQHLLNTGGMLAARLPAHCTSTGKVLLAHAGPEYVREHLPEELPRYSPLTITAIGVLLQDLDHVRAQGCARVRGEYEEYVTALGVPIRDHTASVIASMSISGLSVRIDEETADQMIRALKQAAAEISTALGYVER